MSVQSEKRSNRILFLIFLLIFFAIAIFLSDPARFAKSILKGIDLWAASVLPATFPFLFLTALISAMPAFLKITRKISPFFEKLFRVSGAGAGICVLAALSGYPVGARLLSDLCAEGRVGKEETFRLGCLVTTSGPPFLVGTVGAIMFSSVGAGWILLLCHLLAVWIVCFFLSRGAKAQRFAPPPPKEVDLSLLYDTLYNAVISILCVGGLIALFYCFGDMLGGLGLFSIFPSAYGEGILRGLLEMTAGCSILSKNHTPLSLALCCAIVTFGGTCVLFQEIAFLSRTKIQTGKFVLIKLLQAVVAFCLCFPLALLVL